MNFSAVILCGGRSRRMGRDKALLPVDGEPLLLRQIRLLRQLGPTEVVLSVRPRAAPEINPSLEVTLLSDAYPECGPLGGIATILEHVQTNHSLVLAVDMPHMSSRVLEALLKSCHPGSGVAPRLNDAIEPLAAVYHRDSLPIARDLIGRKKYSMRSFAEHCAAAGQLTYLDIAEADCTAFENWNRPEDLAACRGSGKARQAARLS